MATVDDPSLLDQIVNWFTGDEGAKPSTEKEEDKPPVVPEDNEACENTGVTDEGIVKSARWKALISAAILAYNTWNSLRMAKLQRDLAQRYLDLANEHRRYYNERFKPLEVSLTEEALALPKYVRDRDDIYKGQMMVSAKIGDIGKLKHTMSCTSRYCTGLRASLLQDHLLQQAAVQSAASGMAHRYADKEEITHNNLRWDKRENVEKIGRDIPTQALAFANLAAGIFGRLGEQSARAAEGSAEFLGYNSARLNTVYNPDRPPMTLSKYRYDPTPLPAVPQNKPAPVPKLILSQ